MPKQKLVGSFERIELIDLAKWFGVTEAKAKEAQDGIGFMYRQLAEPRKYDDMPFTETDRQAPWARISPDQTTLERRIECIKLIQELKQPDEKPGNVMLRALRALKWVSAGNAKRYSDLTGDTFPYLYYWNRQNRKGQFCKVTARGKLNSCCLEFEDGYKMVTSRNALRRRKGKG